jgi:NADPH:quinone reductase-like Zn-dependent oxidoreductase
MSTSKLEPLRGPPAPESRGPTMQAVAQTRHGPAPEELFQVAEIARATLGDGEVLVRVHAAGVDRGTWHIMAGLPHPIGSAGSGLRRPRYANPGRSLAGRRPSRSWPVGRASGRRTGTTARAVARRIRPVEPRHLIVLTGLVESGRVTPVVDRAHPLEEAAAVRHMLDGRARGKVVSVSPNGIQTPPPGSTP